MFDLTNSTVYQNGLAEGEQKVKFVAIPRMVDFGLKLTEIAELLDLSLDTVEKFVEEKRQQEIGKKEFQLKAISNMIRLSLSLETIAEYLDLSLDEVQRLVKENDQVD